MTSVLTLDKDFLREAPVGCATRGQSSLMVSYETTLTDASLMLPATFDGDS